MVLCASSGKSKWSWLLFSTCKTNFESTTGVDSLTTFLRISPPNHQTSTSLLYTRFLTPAHLHKRLSEQAIQFILPLMFPRNALFSLKQANVGMSHLLLEVSLRLTSGRYGFKCRFLGGHVHISNPSSSSTDHLTLLQDEDKRAYNALTSREMNYVSADVLKLLRSRKVGRSSSLSVLIWKRNGWQYPFPISDHYLASLGLETTSEAAKVWSGHRKSGNKGDNGAIVIEEPEQQNEEFGMNTDILVEKRTADPISATFSGESHRDSPDAWVRFAEKKRLHWRGLRCPFLFGS